MSLTEIKRGKEGERGYWKWGVENNVRKKGRIQTQGLRLVHNGDSPGFV